LRRVMDVWSTLPEAIRKGILAIVESSAQAKR
jgi:hypothetical protein